MSLEGYWLILLTRVSMLMLLISVSVLILFYSGAVLVLMTGIFVGGFTIIWLIIMVERTSKVPVDNGFNHLMVCIYVNV